MTWQSQATAILTASLVRPLVLAAAAWLILRVFKVRHPASRHAVWTAVLVGMLLLPVASMIAPHWKLPLLPRHDAPTTQPPLQTNDTSADDLSGLAPGAVLPTSHAPAPQAKVFEWPAPATMLLLCYLAGVLAMVVFRLTGWALLWRVMSKSRALRTRLRESSEVITPVTVGVLCPSVILPAGWRSWQTDTKRAVLAHEFAHIRRGDTWISCLTRLAKCVYWFHPLAWWISRQIADLAELSCDAVVLEKNGDPGGYSRILLGFAETVNAAGYRATLPGLAMASRSGMSRRIDQVFELAGGNLRRLSRPGIVLVLMGLPVMCIAAVIGLTAPASHTLQQAPQPVVLAQSQPPASPPQGQPRTPATAPLPAPGLKFDSASVKPCSPGDAAAGGRGGGRGPSLDMSPGRLNVTCMTVSQLVGVANGLFPFDGDQFRGGPAWAHSDRYTIEATSDDSRANGPTGGGSTPSDRTLKAMLQALLAERFRLKIHHQTEEIPVYALTVAKAGLKLKPVEKGSCAEPDPAVPNHVPAPGEKPECHSISNGKNGPNATNGWNAPNWAFDYVGISLGEFAAQIGANLDHRVVDKSGVTDLFSFHLEFARDENTPGPASPGGAPLFDPPPAVPAGVPAGPSIFTALEQLGLKLESAKSSRDYIVIDSVERPSEN